MTQYQRDFVRMLDSMREDHKGESTCLGVESEECEKCPLTNFCENDICFNAEKIIEVVTQWAKEHPFVTYEQAYEETFGVEPKNRYGEYICPRPLIEIDACDSKHSEDCDKCKKEFWGSEYKPPKKEGE